MRLGWGGGPPGDRACFSSISIPSHREKLTSRSELYCSAEESWTGTQGFAASNEAATWEGNGDGGGLHCSGLAGGVCGTGGTTGGPCHLSFFHPVAMESPRTTYINLEKVDTSQKVGAMSPGP